MRLSLAVLGCLPILFWATPALAQQEREEPELPDIAPREVEIRGKLEISFPALRRPELTGLLPQARLEPLPPLPVPRVEAVEPPAAAPQALSDEETIPSGFATLPPPQTGLIEAGGGRYFSRFARARLNHSLSPQWALRSHLDYEGTDGFQPFDDEEVATPADELRGSVAVRTERDALSASLTTHGFFAQHRLYGAERPTASTAAAPSRDRVGGSAVLHLQGGTRVPLEARARYDGAQIRTEGLDDSDTSLSFSEQRFSGTLSARAPLAGFHVEADVHGSTAHLSGIDDDASNSYEGSVSFVDAGAGAWIRESDRYRIFAGARLLTFSGDDDGTYVAPDLRLEWQARPGLTLYARTDPGAEANRLADRYRENPSLLYETAPQPVVRTLDAEGGVRFFPHRTIELHAFAGYQRAPSYLFYEAPPSDPSAASPYTAGITTAHYGKARILQAGGALSFRQTGKVHASLSATFRSGQLADSEADLPYFSPLVAQALLAYDFSGGKGRLQLTGSFESARPLRRSGEEEVGAFADLDVQGRYALTPTLGLVVQLQNLAAGALERYHRYPHPPLVFQTGLRVNL